MTGEKWKWQRIEEILDGLRVSGLQWMWDSNGNLIGQDCWNISHWLGIWGLYFGNEYLTPAHNKFRINIWKSIEDIPIVLLTPKWKYCCH